VRYSSEHKRETRARVLKEAAGVIRAKGPDGVAVADIMARAGLTHGAFYAHFASKTDLVSEAVTAMFGDVNDKISELGGDGDARTALRIVLAFYLSAAHRDNPSDGCPMPALSGDIARAAGPARACFTEGVEKTAAGLTALLNAAGVENAEREALALQAQLVGAISLARAVSAPSLSDAILQDCFAQICDRYGLAQS
jgi:TetR/AcrR family transcriptional regulator, transcriptional repressor for nem operon